MDATTRQRRTLEAVKSVLLRETQAQPVLLVLEDLHWIDSATQALLDSLVESLPAARMLLLVNYRPEYQHGWSGKTYFSQLRLDPLPPETAEGMLDMLMGGDAELVPLKRLLTDRTHGNPFFLEETVRSLVESQVLTGPPASHSSRSSGERITSIPVSTSRSTRCGWPAASSTAMLAPVRRPTT